MAVQHNRGEEILTFARATQIYDAASRRGRPVRLPAPNTRLFSYEQGEDRVMCVQLHTTHIIKLYANGDVVLNTGRYTTRTTKNRMERYSPFAPYIHRGQWRLPSTDGAILIYQDGVRISSSGDLRTALPAPAVAISAKLRRLIYDYASDYALGHYYGREHELFAMDEGEWSLYSDENQFADVLARWVFPARWLNFFMSRRLDNNAAGDLGSRMREMLTRRITLNNLVADILAQGTEEAFIERARAARKARFG